MRRGLTLRQRVFDRDRGVCAACGLRTQKLARLRLERPDVFAAWERRMIARGRFAVSIPAHRKTLWDADHIHGKADGGPDLLSNLRTLCHWCHVRRTAVQQAVRRAFA
jgi:5-methylcytosine-specific restriction endonuclease McrA